MTHPLKDIDGGKVLPQMKGTIACTAEYPQKVFDQDNNNRGYNKAVAEIHSLAVEIDMKELMECIKLGYDNTGIRFHGTSNTLDKLWNEIATAIASNKSILRLVKEKI